MRGGIALSLPEEVEEAEMIFIAMMCREMKWTFEDFINQPAWLIETISLQLQAEKEATNPEKDVL